MPQEISLVTTVAESRPFFHFALHSVCLLFNSVYMKLGLMILSFRATVEGFHEIFVKFSNISAV